MRVNEIEIDLAKIVLFDRVVRRIHIFDIQFHLENTYVCK